jgi:hypothetical protein
MISVCTSRSTLCTIAYIIPTVWFLLLLFSSSFYLNSTATSIAATVNTLHHRCRSTATAIQHLCTNSPLRNFLSSLPLFFVFATEKVNFGSDLKTFNSLLRPQPRTQLPPTVRNPHSPTTTPIPTLIATATSTSTTRLD